MSKVFRNNKIFWFAVVSLSLLGLMLVGAGSVGAASCTLTDETGTMQTGECSESCSGARILPYVSGTYAPWEPTRLCAPGDLPPAGEEDLYDPTWECCETVSTRVTDPPPVAAAPAANPTAPGDTCQNQDASQTGVCISGAKCPNNDPIDMGASFAGCPTCCASTPGPGSNNSCAGSLSGQSMPGTCSTTCPNDRRITAAAATSCAVGVPTLYCCAAPPPTQPTACSGTIGTDTTTVPGVCQAACTDAANTITDATNKCGTQKCCKTTTGATAYDHCAAGTGKNPAGGTCAKPCPSGQSEVSIPSGNECVADGKLCCKAADAAGGGAGAGGGSGTGSTPDEAGKFAKVISWFIALLIQLFGAILMGVVDLIVRVSRFNQIVNSYYVVTGWIVLRDLVNMFFVLGLLFIAFVTVLKIERYQWQKLLPKLLIMAVVVNFSRTICGLIIDFFQVMMFTFVNAFKDIAAENVFKGMGFRDFWDTVSSQAADGAQLGGMMLVTGKLMVLIYVIIALIVMLIFLVILVFRIIILWVLVVFSPLAFFSSAFSGISAKVGSYWTKWFSMFIEYCMVGPLMAFFLWLSILCLGSDYTTMYAQQMSPENISSQGQASLSNAVTNNKAGRLDYIMKYVLGILMLVAGLKFTSEMKVMGASYAGKAATKIQGSALGVADRLAKGGYKYAGLTAKEGLGNIERRGGISGSIAKAARLVGTKEGRQMMGDRMEARIKGSRFIGGQRGALVEQRNKEIERYKKQYESMGADKDPKILAEQLGKATGDRRIALLNIKGEQGKMNREDFEKALGDDDFKHFGVATKEELDAETGKMKKVVDVEKSQPGGLANLEALSKKWEDDYEKKNGLRISISPFIRNPITNEWESAGAGSEGEAKKRKDIEDHLAKQGRDTLQRAVGSGDFSSSGDLRTDMAHLSAAGRNDYLKTAGKESREKVKEKAQELITRLTGDDAAQNTLANKLADKKGLTGDKRDEFIKKQLQQNSDYRKARNTMTTEEREAELKQLQNIQRSHEVSTGDYEPGTGRLLTAGSVNTDLSAMIKGAQLEKRPRYKELRESNSTLAKDIDEIMPGVLKSTELLPMDQRVAAIKANISSILELPKKGFQGHAALERLETLIPEYIANSQDITKQADVKKSYGGMVTQQLNKLSNLAVRGASGREIAIAGSELEGLIAGMDHSVASSGMSPEYFKFDKLKAMLDDIKKMPADNAKKQQDVMAGVLRDAKANDYFDYKLPGYVDKRQPPTGGGSGGGGSATPPAAPPPVPTTPAPAPAPAAPAAPPAPAAVPIVNIVENVTNNLNSNIQHLGSTSGSNTELVNGLRVMMNRMFDDKLSSKQGSLGSNIDAGVKQQISDKFAAIEAAIAGSANVGAGRKQFNDGMAEIKAMVGKLGKT